jgi:hypothetical protein
MKDVQFWMLLISACSTFAAAVALFLNWKAIRENRKTRELQIFNSIFQELKELEEKQKEYETEEEKKAWDSLFFNTLEYFSFLLNKEYLSDRKILSFFKDAIIAWYEQIFLEHSTKEEQKDGKIYPELKNLYKEIKVSRN